MYHQPGVTLKILNALIIILVWCVYSVCYFIFTSSVETKSKLFHFFRNINRPDPKPGIPVAKPAEPVKPSIPVAQPLHPVIAEPIFDSKPIKMDGRNPSRPISMYMIIVLNIAAIIMFLVCLFYSPWNEVFKKEVDAASKIMDEYILKKEKREKAKAVVKDIPYVKPKWTNTTKTYNTLIKDTEKLFTEEVWDEKLKKYDTVIKDIESLPTKEPSIDAWKETIRKYSENIPEKIYEEQIKNVWVEALSKQNRYYLLGFMLLSLLPFFYFLIYILTHTVPEIDIFIQRPFSFLMLILTLFYTAVILLLYTVTKKTYATIIPILLFFFLAGILYFQKYLHLFTTLGIFAICIVESFLVFYNVAFAWCLIPLLPLFFLLFTLYTQQQR